MTDDIAAPAAKARSLDAFLPAGERTDAHIVDRLIEERCPKLRASPAWPVARPLLYSLLGYGKARAMADDTSRYVTCVPYSSIRTSTAAASTGKVGRERASTT
jgi:hypothetical protein